MLFSKGVASISWPPCVYVLDLFLYREEVSLLSHMDMAVTYKYPVCSIFFLLISSVSALIVEAV